MSEETDDYTDNDLPPPVEWHWDLARVCLLAFGLGVGLLLVFIALLVLAQVAHKLRG